MKTKFLHLTALCLLSAGCASSPGDQQPVKGSTAAQSEQDGCPCTVVAKPDGQGHHELRIVTSRATRNERILRSPDPIDLPTLSEDFSLVAYRMQRGTSFDVHVQDISTGVYIVVATRATNQFAFHFSALGLVLADSNGEAVIASNYSLKQALYQRELRMRRPNG
ncbi:hypothetical protein [Piscinibacter gummiphilus]|uniref:Lipoprotein n=1 Tax=Piscinibacter gummiphilus TaxID=946333 RepID=A0ABZ0CR17_9BURK|nr:hypothetical protein [Piscinibacter gummiphilus]WOB06951.1 hypothetical protein RXV79_18735 [Piscinibacter gummiphilus]